MGARAARYGMHPSSARPGGRHGPAGACTGPLRGRYGTAYGTAYGAAYGAAYGTAYGTVRARPARALGASWEPCGPENRIPTKSVGQFSGYPPCNIFD